MVGICRIASIPAVRVARRAPVIIRKARRCALSNNFRLNAIAVPVIQNKAPQSVQARSNDDFVQPLSKFRAETPSLTNSLLTHH